MAEVGILGEDSRTELIDGQIVEKMPQGKAHVLAIKLTYRALLVAFGADFDLSMQMPLPLGQEGEPEPDILVLRGDPRDYGSRDPDPAKDVALVVEVSDSSLLYDRRTKAALYASHGVPEYWIVDLRHRTVEVRRHPADGVYAETFVLRENDPIGVEGKTLVVSDILPNIVPEMP